MRFRLLTYLVVIAASSCHPDSEAPNSSGGVTLELTLSSTNLNRGQSDTVAMTITNTASKTVALNGGVCEPRAIIVDEHAHVVAGAEPCILVLRRLQIAPGEQY